MSNPCSKCAKLSIELLLDLACIDFKAHTFSQEAYFQHHQSFDDLEDAARQGCDFCLLVLESFYRTPCPDEDPWEWPDEWIDDVESQQDLHSNTLYSVLKGLGVSNIKLCLNATHLYSGQGFEDAQVFDEILVQVGKPYSETEDGTSIWSCPLLRLSLIMPTGESQTTFKNVPRTIIQG